MKALLGILCLTALIMLSGCGYRITGSTSKTHPLGISELSIPFFVNKTHEPGIEAHVTQAFVSEFMSAVKVTDDSDLSLVGVIKSYEQKPVSYNKSDVSQEYRLTVVMSLSIKRASTKEVLWTDTAYKDYEDYIVNIDDVSATRESEARAFNKIAKDAARNIKERLLED